MAHRSARFAAAFLAAATVVPSAAHAYEKGSLRGSPGSVDRMYEYAVDHDLRFVRNAAAARSAVDGGRLLPLPTSGPYIHYRVEGANYPYATAATSDFVRHLAASYRNACGGRLVVTSALRPKSEQPRNASPKSVHPTGMALDFRKPGGKCLTWLRGALRTLERAGVIEATEENRPPHMHVAVFGDRWQRWVRGELSPAPAALAARPAGAGAEAGPAKVAAKKKVAPAKKAAPAKQVAARRYTVKKGDSLWSIARRHGTTVARLRAANGLRSSTVRPGARLVLPR